MAGGIKHGREKTLGGNLLVQEILQKFSVISVAGPVYEMLQFVQCGKVTSERHA